MRKSLRNILVVTLLSVVLVAMVSCASVKKNDVSVGKYSGKTIILHDNDVHGAIAGYAKMAALKAEYEKQGAKVIVVSAGDFSQGTLYVSLSKGLNAVKLMDAVGYDIVTLGNHEFDFGYPSLKNILKDAKFDVLCSNVFEKGKTVFKSDKVIKVDGVKIGFFALETPETLTKVNPGLIQGLEFAGTDEATSKKYNLYDVAQKEAKKLSKKADVVICIAHLGVDGESLEKGCASYDVWKKLSGVDFMIDGHSHTVMTKGDKNQPIQSTGTAFANIGVVVIDNASKKIVDNYLVDCATVKADSEIEAMAKKMKADVDAEYNAVFAKSEVLLNGAKAPQGNRDSETNLGDIITDAMIWNVLKGGPTKVADDHVVAIVNGGCIRATIKAGEVSKAVVNTVLPFGNTIAVEYVKGSEILEALEASTFCTPSAVGGFPQVSGIKFTVNTKIPYDKGNVYPGSTYSAPKSIKRVSIESINGKPFNANDTYALVTSNFCAAGGDTYYAFKRAFDAGNGFDTAMPLDEALMEYVSVALNGTIGKTYEKPQGRITIK